MISRLKAREPVIDQRITIYLSLLRLTVKVREALPHPIKCLSIRPSPNDWGYRAKTFSLSEDFHCSHFAINETQGQWNSSQMRSRTIA